MLQNTTNKGVIIMRRLVSKCNNNLPIIPLSPCDITSSDDTTNYVDEGKGEKRIHLY